jgi:hypothetical protein
MYISTNCPAQKAFYDECPMPEGEMLKSETEMLSAHLQNAMPKHRVLQVNPLWLLFAYGRLPVPCGA